MEIQDKMWKVELLPIGDCQAGYAPGCMMYAHLEILTTTVVLSLYGGNDGCSGSAYTIGR